MRTFRCFIYAICLVCMMACNNEDIHFEKEDDSRVIAYDHVSKRLRQDGITLTDVDIWVTKEKIPANSVEEITPYDRIVSPGTESWLFFVDELPGANWEHPCRYLFVDRNGEILVYEKTVPPSYFNMELVNTSEFTRNNHSHHITPELSLKTKSVTLLDNHYAIVLSGGGNRYSNHVRYWNDCSYIYTILTSQYGYDPSKIYVLMADGTDPGIDNSNGLSSNPDLDGDNNDDIDYAATNQNLNNVFGLLSSQLTDDDYLFIYTIDHGGLDPYLDESYIWMWGEERYYASDFANKVKSINTKATHIVMGQCHSGGFVEYFNNSPNICISTACGKYERSWAMTSGLYDEYVYYWTQSHTSANGDINGDNHISAWDSYHYAQSRDTRNETPCHYGAGYLSERLTLMGQYQNSYDTFIDGYCTFNYNATDERPFYAGEPDHEPEFGVSRGDKIDITVTRPDINTYPFEWSITENNNHVIFSPNNTRAHMEVNSQIAVGQRIRVRVEANIPADNYQVIQYLNFYVTSNYRIAKSTKNILTIENSDIDKSPATSNAKASVFEYQIVASDSKVKISGTYSKNQRLNLDISNLSKGVYTLIIREDGDLKAKQRLTI